MQLLSPYPGLRPFEVDESHLFFGREEQTDELLHRLHATHFLAVVGPSGCGKSSLVRAGMIAALGAGFMVAAGARWQFAIMRPEGRPMHNLANALVEQTGIGSEEADKTIAAGLLEATLRRGPLGVVEAMRDTPIPADTNLLILVDQFEEIFRFEREGGRDEADAFVSLLLATAAQREAPVYVVITMRSDFFGDCAIFDGLPEALNESQYLTPRLTREQRQDAIVGPARVFGGDVAPDLVNRLLNQMGTDPDQLPLMQHLLMRMWTWRFPPQESAVAGLDRLGTEADPSATRHELTLADCDAVGGLNQALSRHADEAFEELDDRQKSIAETLFRLLSERAPGNRDIRRPTPAGEVAELAGASLDELVAVVETFRAPGRSFIVPPFPDPIGDERVLDITHESLIRQWDRLREWAEKEERSAEIYRFLAKTASLWKQGESALWQSPNLEIGLDWRTREQPTALWAKRYGGDFALATAFLAESEKAREAREAEAAARRRAEIRRWRTAFASSSAVALLLVAAVVGIYEAYFAEQVRYYRSFVKRFGEPVGIGELSSAQVRHRAVSLKFVRNGFLHPVFRIEAVDADGNCAHRNSVGTHLQDQREVDNTSPLHECRWEFVYDDQRQVIYEKAYNKEGQLRWGYSYTPGEQQTMSRTAYYVDRNGFPARFQNSLAEIVRFDYSPRGYEIRETWMDRQGQAQPVKDRAYGREHEYDEHGREIRMTSLDQQWRKLNDTAGNATQVLAYDRFGNIVDSKALDKDDRPVLFKGGYYEYTTTFDENGNATSRAFFDIAAHPTVNEDGAHLIEYEYDKKGNLSNLRYYDTERNPTITREGFHKIVFLVRDGHGDLLRWAYFGITGESTIDSNGAHEYRKTYDPHGFLESQAGFDKEGRPTTGKNGFYRVEWQYDGDGNKQWESYFDREGKPTRIIGGSYRLKLTHDDRGNITEWAHFDVDDLPILTDNGYHRKIAKYDAAGFKIEEELFGKKDEPVPGKDGCHKVTMLYDPRGNQTENSCLDNNNNLVNRAEGGYARLRKTYDGRDNPIEWAYYGSDDRLTDYGRGYAILRQEYDDQDRVTVKAYHNTDGRLTMGPDEVAVVHWQYEGNRKDERYYDSAERPIALNGCMVYRAVLDRRSGKQTEGYCLNAVGDLVRFVSGAAIIRMKYDDHGREIEKASYGEDQQLVSVRNYAVIRKKYDAYGNQVEEAYFGEDGRLRLGPDGYAIFRSKYDDHGTPTETAYYGEDESVRIHPKHGYAIGRAKYDNRGNQIEFARFGEDGALRLGPEGYASSRAKFDDQGRQTEYAYYGDDGKLRLHPKHGYAIVRTKYDDHGNKIEEAYFGEDENLRLVPEGYAIFRNKYDERGKLIEIAYFGIDGKARLHPTEGYAVLRAKYDDRGNIVERATFGENGELRNRSAGYAVNRTKYDASGHKIEDAYYGEDEHPSYAIVRDKYDDRGNKMEETYVAEDGSLTSSWHGFAMVTKLTEIFVRDERQRLIAQCQNGEIDEFLQHPKACSDAADRPLISHPVIVEVFAGSRAEALGLRVGDIVEAYDGKPVFTTQELIDLVVQPGAGERDINLVRQGRSLVFKSPPGRLGMRLALTFVSADQPASAEHAGR